MKKLTTAVVAALTALSASADGWMGGGIGVGFNNHKEDGGVSTNTLSANFAPEIGFKINDKFAFGFELYGDWSNRDVTIPEEAIKDDPTVLTNVDLQKRKTLTFGGGVFGRYTFTDNETVNFFVEIAPHYNFGIEFANEEKTEEVNNIITGGTTGTGTSSGSRAGTSTTDKDKDKKKKDITTPGFDVKLRPGLVVELSETWKIVGRLDLFTFNHVTRKSQLSNGDDTQLTKNDMNFKFSTGLSVSFVHIF